MADGIVVTLQSSCFCLVTIYRHDIPAFEDFFSFVDSLIEIVAYSFHQIYDNE